MTPCDNNEGDEHPSTMPLSGRQSLIGKMLGSEVSIRFLSKSEVLAIHDQMLARFGGGVGVRSHELLESALHRPMTAACYDESIDAVSAGAMLIDGVIQNHPFIDGNKRAGYFCGVVLLKKNGYDFDPDPAEAVYMITTLASGETSFDQFVDWFRVNAHPEVDRHQPASSQKP